MKREIKFRVWSINKKEMGKPFELMSALKLANTIPIQTGWENHILMQFTGLYDKNGKEIYEGDIVRYKESEQEKEGDFYFTTKLVQFYKGSFGFENWNTHSSGVLTEEFTCSPARNAIREIFYKKFDIEVIGNIHENPELL